MSSVNHFVYSQKTTHSSHQPSKSYDPNFSQQTPIFRYNYLNFPTSITTQFIKITSSSSIQIQRLFHRFIPQLPYYPTSSPSFQNRVGDESTRQVVAAAGRECSGVAAEVLMFPMIANPLVADGSVKSHNMSLVFSHGCLNTLKPPIVLQEFVNHGGGIFKAYVAGDFIKCVKRKSLPGVLEKKLKSLDN